LNRALESKSWSAFCPQDRIHFCGDALWMGAANMAEPDFERRLERLFADPPGFADAEVFARRLERRLDHGWTLRRALIGAAGVAGGVIAVSQILVSGPVGRLGAAEHSVHALAASLSRPAAGQWLAILPSGEGVVWTAVGVAIALSGFVLTRVIEEF
jgi:hypothetical protein